MKVQGTYTADSQFSNPVEYNPMCEKEEEIKSKWKEQQYRSQHEDPRLKNRWETRKES